MYPCEHFLVSSLKKLLSPLSNSCKYLYDAIRCKIEPIRIQESRCMINRVTSNLSIMRCAYVALIVLATVFSMAWYKIVMQCSLVVHRGISQYCHLYFLGIHTCLKGLCVCRENTSDPWIFHGMPLKIVA